MSDFIDLSVWQRKKICCGTIFVNAAGEAILDPRFISKCPCQTNSKFKESLMSLENIVKKELENVQSVQSAGNTHLAAVTACMTAVTAWDAGNTQLAAGHNFKVPDRKERKDSEKSWDSKFSSDHDEGFFDRASSSPCFEESSSLSNGFLQMPIMSQKIPTLPQD